MPNVPTRTTSVRQGRLAGVQAARGAAALLVVIYHTTRSLSLPQYLGHVPFENAFGFGHAGVDFFFVLSGFIIMYAHESDVARPERLYRYLWRRITRIYPLYWVVTAIEVVRAVGSADAASRLAPSHIWHSLLLLPERAEPLVSVAWTLRSEMLFYLVFALPILDRRLCKPLVLGTLLLVGCGLIITPTEPWLGLLVSPFNTQFLMGIAVAKILSRRRIPRPAAFVALGLCFFLAVGVCEVLGVVPLNGLVGRLLYGSGAVAMLLGLVEVERRGTSFGGVGVMLGDASYCLYLIHLSIIPLAVRGLVNSGLLAIFPVSIVVGALVGLSVVLAVALHNWLELPMMNFIRRRTPRFCR